jgi:uncharacterized protein YjbI with pentapeptide repeats
MKRVSLTRADLTRANLSGAHPANANLTRTFLAGARYDGTTLWPKVLTPAQPRQLTWMTDGSWKN